MRLLATTAILTMTIFTVATAQNKYSRDVDGDFIVKVGDEMPPFQYVTLDGDTLDSDFLKGQIVIIQFVASWCPYGRGQMKAVEDLIWKKHGKPSDLSIIGFSEDFATDTAEFRRMIADKGISYPFAFDNDERVFKAFVTPKATVTRLIIVDRESKIVSLEDEFYRKSFRRTRKTIKKMLRQKTDF